MSFVSEPSAEYVKRTEQLARTEDTEVTIKFGNNKESIRVKASKGSLIAGSTYFADHWFKHPRSSVIKAPLFIIPGVTIKQQSIDAAIGHLHGEDADSDDVADAVELILLARALGIPTLELQASKTIEEQLERCFEIDGLAAAVRELYEAFREDIYCAIGNDVVAVVTRIAARVCSRRLAVLRSDAAFTLLRRDVPQLTEDMLDAVADENERYGNEVKSEEQGSVPPQDAPQELQE